MEERNGDSIQEQLLTAQHRFMKAHREICFTGMRKSEFMMLEVIQRESRRSEGMGAYASDIAKSLKITAPAVSKMLKSMEEQGYVERKADAKDRRNTIVTITASGSEAGERIRSQMEDFVREVIKEFGEENARRLIELLNQYTGIIRQESLDRKKRMQEEYNEADL